MKNNEILWAKIRPEAVIPTKRDEDAGFDLYACFYEDYLVINSGETKFIGLGVASAFPENYVVFLKERGSTAKYGLSIRSGVIDSGYRGEYVLAITNVGNQSVVIYNTQWYSHDEDNGLIMTDKDGELIKHVQFQYPSLFYPASKAICQAVLLPLPKLQSREVSYEELTEIKSERGTGLMGSSGK